MKKKQTQKLPLIFSLTVLVGIVTSLLWLRQKTVAIPKPPVLVVNVPIPSISPSRVHQVVSPDGAQTLHLTIKDAMARLLVNDREVMTKKLPEGAGIVLPFNAWSPDNKYFFVLGTQAERETYTVMKADGMVVSDDVGALFVQAQPDFSLVEITGWASPTLLVLNAASASGSSLSFWFDIQSRKFIRLSTYFN